LQAGGLSNAITFSRDEPLFGVMREPIPLLSVPLREPDPDVALDLTLAIQTIYDRAHYDMRIDYTQPPPKPDFSVEDEAWIKQLVS
jgi:hypothetical protein